MNVLIAGGTGLLGNALTVELLKRNHRVWILSRNPPAAKVPVGAEATWWDANTPQGWERRVAETDAVINLAGENIGGKRWTAQQKAMIRSSRQQVGQALVLGIQQSPRKPEILLQSSAIGIYGPCDDRILDEESPLGNDFLARVARDWEASTQPVEEMGVTRVITRTGLVITSQEGFMAPLLSAFRLFAGGPLGSGKQWWSWIHIQDYVGAVLCLMEQGGRGVFNLTAPNPCRMEEFGRSLAGVIKRPYWLPTPAFGLRLLLGEMSSLVLDGQKVSPRNLLRMGYKFSYPELVPALKDILYT